MLYALNLFNFVPGKEDQYRHYSVLAGKIIYGWAGALSPRAMRLCVICTATSSAGR